MRKSQCYQNNDKSVIQVAIKIEFIFVKQDAFNFVQTNSEILPFVFLYYIKNISLILCQF